MVDIERLQASYCNVIDREYRRAVGQFFTPRWIAEGMAQWVLGCKPDVIVDPACGFGVLLDACRNLGHKGQLMGYEIDAELVQRAHEGYFGEPTINVRCTDFLATSRQEIPAAIVNPPYNKFQRRDLPQGLLLEIARETGMLASGFTNQYALFLYLVLARLRQGGRAAFIVPSEFLATGYGAQVKQYLLDNRRLRQLIIFDTDERIFPEAATTACVMLFDVAPCDSLAVWHLAGLSDAQQYAALCAGRPTRTADAEIPYEALEAESNWQGLGRVEADFNGFVPFRVFGEVKRGIATGANEFFILKPSEAKSLGLTSSDLQPCIASAGAVPELVFTDDMWSSLCQEDRPCYLFDGVAGQGQAARQYLAYGEEQGYHQRYLTRMRKPWYRLESRRPAPLLLAVFGRDGFRVSLNRSRAVNLTAFHGFYPSGPFHVLLPTIWLYFKTSTAQEAFARQQRSYGDGLKKLEPGDWSKLMVPDWRSWSLSELQTVATWAEEAALTFLCGNNERFGFLVARFDEFIRRRQLYMVPVQPHEGQIQMSLV